MQQENLSSAEPKRILKPFLRKPSKSQWEGEAASEQLTETHSLAHIENEKLKVWFDWVYELHLNQFLKDEGPTVELGSGGSKFKTKYPQLVTSDILEVPGIDLVVDAHNMPFDAASVSNLTLINVLHHLQQPFKFFSESHRVLKPGGRLVFTEPYVGPFSHLIYKYLHHEYCDLYENILRLPPGDALRNSNQAMPTQLLKYYLEDILKIAPDFQLSFFQLHSSWSYFATGGVNYELPVPMKIYKHLFKLDHWICKLLGQTLASYMTVVFEKRK